MFPADLLLGSISSGRCEPPGLLHSVVPVSLSSVFVSAHLRCRLQQKGVWALEDRTSQHAPWGSHLVPEAVVVAVLPILEQWGGSTTDFFSEEGLGLWWAG